MFRSCSPISQSVDLLFLANIHMEICLCAEFGIEHDYMKYFFATDHTLFRRTEFCTPADNLELEFDKLIKIGARFRKFRRCGRYFLIYKTGAYILFR